MVSVYTVKFVVIPVYRHLRETKSGMGRPACLVKPVCLSKIPGRYLAHQESLPKLPVPPLKQTCDHYLAALEPIVTPEELQHTQRLVEEFQLPGGLGDKLQSSLERRAKKLENWLSDWWLQTAYLDYRMPVVVHSSPGVVLPRLQFSDWQGQIRSVHYRTNNESVKAIQKSIFTVCLDAPMPKVSDEMYHTRAAVQMLHGGGSRWNSGNRWFDKTLQFIIGEDGTCGVIYEHAPAEGPPIVALIDHVVEYTKKSEMICTPTVPLPMPRKLHFNITPEIKRDIEEAKQNINLMVNDLDVRVIVFTHFGKNVPKSYKMSPDAFIQVALQLAYYRLYKHCCATYESASLRMFRLGRTDTIRSASIAAANFARAMDNPVQQAIRGQAIDRHLLGLKLQAVEDMSTLPKIFTDKSYAIANHYTLSTSQVPAKTDCVMCFGPVVPDGYGVCYNPMEKHINFAVSAFNSCADTNATQLAHGLQDALVDMKSLLDQTLKSKL
ncbi:carnitine O-acetyltransferase [Silurus asotus]|uniref:Carnitine O-acetyltransferase n=1 Tax=Silurus asotus TaxID=30991 RepID=A0AAD5AG70_SILAS|nr:carnitine O-acetyltransferase [Silurus asotus]